MNIGFFGDSYVDLVYTRHHASIEKQIWPQRILTDFDSPALASGLGGTNQFHAIQQWRHHSATTKFDYAIFTFTWQHRLYSQHEGWQQVLSAAAENRDCPEIAKQVRSLEEYQQIVNAVKLYYQYLHDHDQAGFLFELMVQWCLELPKQYPDTKFIFLPNTESARVIAKRNFEQGVLLDFAFETLSASEGDLPGITMYNPDHIGHMSMAFHGMFADIMKDIVANYSTYENKIVPFDYNRFGITVDET